MKLPAIVTPQRLAIPLTRLALLWSRTLRIRQIGWPAIQEHRRQGPIVFTLWHDELFVPCCLHRNEAIIAVVSASRDGEILAQVMGRLGFDLARGSSRREGLRALRAAVRAMKTTGKDAVLTVDGPKGPRHMVKEGAIYLAARVGAPICPIRVRISRAKRFERAWDRFQLPLPGSTCTIIYGRPHSLEASKLDPVSLDRERQVLQERMDSLLEDPAPDT